MKNVVLLLLSLFWALAVFGQDSYLGKFSDTDFYVYTNTKVPIQEHEAYDHDEGITISIKYGDKASIEDINVKVGSKTICYEQIKLPLSELKWTEIQSGIWINEIQEEEDLVNRLIPGFSIGAINVMPNTVRIIKISPEHAYGPTGGANIPPNATIYYVIYNMENPRA